MIGSLYRGIAGYISFSYRNSYLSFSVRFIPILVGLLFFLPNLLLLFLPGAFSSQTKLPSAGGAIFNLGDNRRDKAAQAFLNLVKVAFLYFDR
ncbi:hypothetical protein BH24BAC1_BH24BAC1_23030 [soil metagenome]